LGDIVQLFISQ